MLSILTKLKNATMNKLKRFIIDNAYTYETYRQLIDQEFSENKTTGPDHSEEMLNYTSLNISRMKRLDRKNRLTEGTKAILKTIQRPLTWLVITEGWCGDAAQIIPTLNHMAKENEHISLHFILRDKNLPVMDAFLTNGARSIPIVIILDSNSLEVLGSWGPRPSEVQKMVMDAKNKVKATEDLALQKQLNDTAAQQLHLWYARNKTMDIQREFSSALQNFLHIT